jgi:hypothetical protein
MTITLNATTGISTPPVSVLGDTSGSITFAAPAVAGTNTQTLVAVTGTLAPIVSGTAVASTSGTSIDFTSIPSWVKRITVMLSGVSLSGTSNYLVQLGTSGGVVSSGYTSTCNNGSGAVTTSTAGFLVTVSSAAADLSNGFVTIVNVNSNIWSQTAIINNAGATRISAGGVSLSGTLDRVRITTVNGTDTFDAGSINIMYE